MRLKKFARRVGRLPLKSLDGKTIIGDAFTEADLESEGC
jgi:hypothetical protein